MPGADDDEGPRPLAVEGRPIYKKIDKYERAGDKNCLEPAWKGHWEEELRVDIITALTPALLFDALLGETTEVAGTTFGPIILEAFHLGCGLKTGLKAPAHCTAACPRSLDGDFYHQSIPSERCPSGPLSIQDCKSQQQADTTIL